MKHSIAEVQLSYKPRKLNEALSIRCSEDAYKIILENWDKDTLEFQEEFKVLLLNNSNHVLGIYSLSKGGITNTSVDLRILFAVILKSAATGFISIHNHPSGKLKPSNQDIDIYKKIKEIAKFHEVHYLDNLIITKTGKYSFADEGN